MPASARNRELHRQPATAAPSAGQPTGQSAGQPAGQPTGRPTADRILVDRCLAGDSGAFEELYRAYSDLVYGLCLRLCADPQEAATATQDTFVRAWSKLASYAGRGALGGWLRRMAVNVVYDRKRAQSRRHRLIAPFPSLAANGMRSGGTNGTGRTDDEQDGFEAPAHTSAPDACTERIDLERAVAGLPAGARTVFVLHDVEGYRHREIAKMLGTSVGTSKAQLHRARRLLRMMLGEEIS